MNSFLGYHRALTIYCAPDRVTLVHLEHIRLRPSHLCQSRPASSRFCQLQRANQLSIERKGIPVNRRRSLAECFCLQAKEARMFGNDEDRDVSPILIKCHRPRDIPYLTGLWNAAGTYIRTETGISTSSSNQSEAAQRYMWLANVTFS